MKKNILSIVALLATGVAQARDGFAIVIDPQSYHEAKAEVDAYAQCVEQMHKMKVYTVIDRWQCPDSIRATLIRMHAQKHEPVIGAVLVGDIPVAMVRDAQHLTSAFKMDQRRDRRESSVPSDRFYDDFSLRFRPLGKDAEKPYFYYSLTADSEQRLQPTIYSGRIRPTDAGGTSRYAKLRAYLTKLVAEKRRAGQLRQMFYFSGHGYISESKVARIDEKGAYYEHFPQLKGRTNAIGYMDHSDRNPIKEALMDELMRNDLDLAVLHHHGYWDTQYLNSLQRPNTVKGAKEFIQQYCREHIYAAKQRGKNADSLRVALQQRFDLPASWLANALDDKVAEQDSLTDAAQDLYIADFAHYGYRPNVPVVMIDACFCGSFHLDDCIADEYIFQPGRTVVCIANSVNVLQDKWSDRFLGLINNGGCVADVVRYSTYLESHIIGDPTFRFTPTDGQAPDLDHLINENKPATWRRLLKDTHPDVQSLAIEHLCRLGLLTPAELRRLYETSPYGTVRLQALTRIADHRGHPDALHVIAEATQDSYELAQRQALKLIGRCGDHSLIPALIKVCVSNNTSDRCNFNAMADLSVFPKEALLSEFERQFASPSIAYIRKDSVGNVIRRTIERSAAKWIDDNMKIADTTDSTLTQKKRIMYIRQARNYLAHEAIPTLLGYVQTCADPTIQVALLEALGWHTHSYMAPRIIEVADKMAADNRYTDEVRAEARKTSARLTLLPKP